MYSRPFENRIFIYSTYYTSTKITPLLQFAWSKYVAFVSGNGNPDSKDHGANMGPTWVLSVPGGPHVSPMNLAIREAANIYGAMGTMVYVREQLYNDVFDVYSNCRITRNLLPVGMFVEG